MARVSKEARRATEKRVRMTDTILIAKKGDSVGKGKRRRLRGAAE